MKRILIVGLLLTMASFPIMATTTYAFEGYTGGKERFHNEGTDKMLKCAEALGLSDEQKTQLKELHYSERRERMETRHQMQMKELDLQHELEKATPDKTKIDTVVADLKELEGKKIEQRVSAVLAIRELLTPEQYEKFKEFGVKKVRNRMKKGGTQSSMQCPQSE